MTVEPDEQPADSPSSAPGQAEAFPDDAADSFRMTFGDHLEELRKRMLLSLIGVGVMFIGTLYYGASIVVWLLKPLVAAQRQAGLPPMTVAGITSGFTSYILVAAVAALVIASPWVLYQLWQFIGAGLYATERRMILTIAPLSGLMSLLAVGFLYYVMLPVGLFFFISFTASYPQVPASDQGGLSGAMAWVNRAAVRLSGVPGMSAGVQVTELPDTTPDAQAGQGVAVTALPILPADPPAPVEGQLWVKHPEGEVRLFLHNQVRTLNLGVPSLITPLVQVGEYIKFVAFLALGVVVAFQLPVVMLILGWLGLIQAATIARYRRHALLICFIIAAVLTPLDPVTMTMLGVPMYLLFELGLLMMRLANKASAVRDAQTATP